MAGDGKDMLSFEDCVVMMNPKEHADSFLNQYGIADFNRDGKRPWGTCYKISNRKFGVLAGKSLNPLIFRGENREYDQFLPSAKRGFYTKSDRARKERFLSIYKETPYYKFGTTYKCNLGYHMEIDLEAVAQHYGFKTNYLDVTRLREVAEFFAYTYYDEGEYHPITDFLQYTPCIYTADLHDVYGKKPNSLKLISGQIALRPCHQYAMAVDIEQDFDCKPLFKKEILPKDAARAKKIYKNFNNCLFPKQDILDKIARTISFEDEIDKKMSFKFVMDDEEEIKKDYNLSSLNGISDNSLDLKIINIMKDDVENYFRPLLDSTGCRECAKGDR